MTVHHVLLSGEGSWPVVVFIHGNPSTARFFGETLAAPRWAGPAGTAAG
jgi:hypothetical protein